MQLQLAIMMVRKDDYEDNIASDYENVSKDEKISIDDDDVHQAIQLKVHQAIGQFDTNNG